MAPPRRGRGSSKRGSMPSSRRALRAAAASSSSRRIPDNDGAPQIPSFVVDQPELAGPADERRRSWSPIGAPAWFPTAQGRIEYPRREAPADANNGDYEEIVSIHSSEDAEDVDVSDHIPRQDDHIQQPNAEGPNDGQPGPSRKRRASVALSGPVDKYLRQGPAASPTRPPPVPMPSTQPRAYSTITGHQIAFPSQPRSGMPNIANDQAPAVVNNMTRQLNGIYRQMANFTSGNEHQLSTGSSLRLDMAQQNGLAKEIKSLRARYDDLKGKHKKLGDDHRVLETKNKMLGENNRVLDIRNKRLLTDHRALWARYNKLGEDYRVQETKHKTLGDDFRALTTKHTKLATDYRVLDANFDELKKQNEQLKKENDALRKQHVQDLKNEQIAWCKAKEAKEAADAAKNRIQQLEQDVADRVLEIDIYEEIFIEEGDRERERVMASEGREHLEEDEESEEEESESEEELEDELELED